MAPSPRIPRPLLLPPLSYNSVQAPSQVMESPQLKSTLFSKATAPSGAHLRRRALVNAWAAVFKSVQSSQFNGRPLGGSDSDRLASREQNI